MSIDERPRSSARPTPKWHYNSLPRTSLEAALGNWISYKQASAYCGLGRTTLTSLVVSGAIPAAKVNKSVRISRIGLDEFMRRNAYTQHGQK
jgi:excisionase family DNA binding protein